MSPTVPPKDTLPRSVKVTIPINTALSDPIPLFFGQRPRGIDFDIPAAWTTADLAVQNSRDNATYKDRVGNNGARIKATGVVANTVIQADAGLWGAGSQNYMRLESINVSGEAAVNQAAAREIWVTFYE